MPVQAALVLSLADVLAGETTISAWIQLDGTCLSVWTGCYFAY